jgi:signal transduction histidine kinase
MKALIEDIIGEFASSHGDREILFEGSSVHMEIDRLLFSIALGNIIENALKYSEGKIEIELKEESLSIKDSGIGLEKSDIKKVTQKFYRVSQNSWNNSLGLGLNITYNVIKLHNFKLEIDSEKNVGSTFKILF